MVGAKIPQNHIQLLIHEKAPHFCLLNRYYCLLKLPEFEFYFFPQVAEILA